MGFKYYDFENSSDNADWMLHNGNGSAGFSTEDSHSGDYSLRLRGISTSDNCYGEVGVSNPNEITYWVKLNSDWDTSGTYKDTLYVEYYDGSYHTIREISDDSAIDNWVQYTDSIPSNATKIRFRANITGSTEKCYIDDVIIYPDLDNKDDWEYYKELTISNFDDNYQVKITVYSGSGTDSTNTVYCDSKCHSFPNDIRFGTTNDPDTASQLPQWIEESDSSSATIWVRLPSTTTSSIYIFVGNLSASQYSSGEDTFILFDDFDDSSVDSQWSTTGTVTESGTEITLDGNTSSHAYIKSTTSYGTGYAVRCKMKYVHHATWDASECGFNALEVDNDGVVVRIYGNTSNIKYHSKSGDSTSTYDPGVSKDGNYHIYDVIRTSSTAADFYIDNSNHLTGSTNIPTNDLPVTIFARGTASGYVTTTVSDWVALRLYSSPEPSLSSTGEWISLTDVTCNKDIIISGANCVICCFVNRWDTSDYTFTIETWLKKDDFDNLITSVKPGAVGELYKILDRPYYYDKTWADENTLKFIPVTNSVMGYLRNTTVGYVRNIVASPLEGPSKYIAVKIECFVSGSTL